MPLPPHAADWMNRADIDYIGPFVKAWAAFNAWYRHASGESQEYMMLSYVKNKPNPLRRLILPMLDNANVTADSLALKHTIHELHRNLDAIHLEVTRRNVNERISLRSVCLNPKPLQNEQTERRGQEFKATKVQGGAIEITVKSLRTGKSKFRHTQKLYDASEVYALRAFRENLSRAQRDALSQFYDSCNPRPMRDLIQGNGPPLSIGGAQFHCNPRICSPDWWKPFIR